MRLIQFGFELLSHAGTNEVFHRFRWVVKVVRGQVKVLIQP